MVYGSLVFTNGVYVLIKEISFNVLALVIFGTASGYEIILQQNFPAFC